MWICKYLLIGPKVIYVCTQKFCWWWACDHVTAVIQRSEILLTERDFTFEFYILLEFPSLRSLASQLQSCLWQFEEWSLCTKGFFWPKLCGASYLPVFAFVLWGSIRKLHWVPSVPLCFSISLPSSVGGDATLLSRATKGNLRYRILGHSFLFVSTVCSAQLVSLFTQYLNHDCSPEPKTFSSAHSSSGLHILVKRTPPWQVIIDPKFVASNMMWLELF